MEWKLDCKRYYSQLGLLARPTGMFGNVGSILEVTYFEWLLALVGSVKHDEYSSSVREILHYKNVSHLKF